MRNVLPPRAAIGNSGVLVRVIFHRGPWLSPPLDKQISTTNISKSPPSECCARLHDTRPGPHEKTIRSFVLHCKGCNIEKLWKQYSKDIKWRLISSPISLKDMGLHLERYVPMTSIEMYSRNANLKQYLFFFLCGSLRMFFPRTISSTIISRFSVTKNLYY